MTMQLHIGCYLIVAPVRRTSDQLCAAFGGVRRNGAIFKAPRSTIRSPFVYLLARERVFIGQPETMRSVVCPPDKADDERCNHNKKYTDCPAVANLAHRSPQFNVRASWVDSRSMF